jgi:hypothetical protein
VGKRRTLIHCLAACAGWVAASGSTIAKPDSAEVLRELTDYSVAGMSKRLGPDYDFYHPGGGGKFPEIYLAPAKPVPADAGPPGRGPGGGAGHTRHYQLGGPYTKDPGDYSSTQGQVLYVPDRKLAIDRTTKMPNEGVGVDRVTIIEMSNHCFTEKPEPPWWGGFRPEPTSKIWTDAMGDKLGTPIASARGMGGWSNAGLVLFSSGFVGTAGTVTGKGTDPTFKFPPHKIPTALSITNKNEFALVTVIDREKMIGQVAVLALTSGGKKGNIPHEWADEYPAIASIAALTQIKLLGYIDLPGITFPTGVTAVGNRTGGRVNGRSGHAGMLNEFDLSVQADRDNFREGHNAQFGSTTGFAVVVGKYENKAAFIDLQVLFQRVRDMYFTTAENFAKTRDMGDGPKQWPYTFEGDPTWKPTVVKVVDVTRPTAVLAGMWGSPYASAWIACEDGTIYFYTVGGLATDEPADPNAITVAGTAKVGRNPTCLLYDKYGIGTFIAVSRGDRELDWVVWKGSGGEVTKRLRDARLIDPVFAEASDTHGIETPLLTVADFKGRKILNYRYGILLFGTQGRQTFGIGPTGKDEFECGGILEFPGHPLSLSATNVN